MIIGIDSSRANKAQKTGTEWYSFFIIQELKKIGVKHQFRLYTNTLLEPALAACPENFEQRVLHWPLKYLWTQKRLSWEMLLHPPDVLFVPAHTIPIFCRAKTVVTIPDVGFAAQPQLYPFHEKLYHRASAWFAVHFADRIICPTEFTKRELIKFYHADPAKIAVIPHGVEVPKNIESTKWNRPYLLYMGRVEQKKNIMNLLEAYALVHMKHQDLRLILAGRLGFGGKECVAWVNSQGLGQSVEFTGSIIEDRKWSLYRGALALVFATLYEGFGLPLLEAQAVGCPVVTSDLPAHREVAQEAAVYVDPASPQSIAQGIERASDPGVAQNLGKLGRLNAANFTWSKTAAST